LITQIPPLGPSPEHRDDDGLSDIQKLDLIGINDVWLDRNGFPKASEYLLGSDPSQPSVIGRPSRRVEDANLV
jgi:hypothetical protein